LYRKIQKDNIFINKKINNSNNSNTIKYNTENNEFQKNKNFILFTNNKNNNTLNNISNYDEDRNKINNNHIYRKIEILSPFNSINNYKSDNNSHKKFYINNIQNNNNNSQKSNNKKINNNNRIRHNHTHTLTSINSNNIIYELNNDYESNYKRFNNNNINNYNGNNFLYISTDKERNTLSNKSYGNLNINRNISKEIYGGKNIINFDYLNIDKSISPIHQIKNKYK
jgi:hypothetical protein